MKSKLTYKGPLALYVSYYLLLALAIVLMALSFRVDPESVLFMQLLITGIGTALVSLTMILYYTQIERKILPHQWRKNVSNYYNDEGIFEYIPDGFTVMTKQGESLSVRWKEVFRADSGENKLNDHFKKFHIDLYLNGEFNEGKLTDESKQIDRIFRQQQRSVTY